MWTAGRAQAAAAAGQHPGRSREDRGGLHNGETVHQQDEVGSQVADTALQSAGVVADGEQQETRRSRESVVGVQTAHSAGRFSCQWHLTLTTIFDLFLSYGVKLSVPVIGAGVII